MILEYIRRQIDWSLVTFGAGSRTLGVTNHIRKELVEIEENPTDLEEWIDVIILAFDGAWRAGYNEFQIVQMLELKQEKNFKRKFIVSLDPTLPTEHDRSIEP